MTRGVAAAAAACIALAAPRHGAANPLDHFGFGARAASMAGAQTASTDDTGANYYNPAALATFDTIRFDLGYQIAVPSLRINDQDLRVDSSRGFSIGLAVPGRIGPRGIIKLAIGGGLFIPDQQITRVRSVASDQPRFVLYDNRPQRMFLGANVAVSIADVVFLGGGIAYLSSTAGAVTLDGRLGFPIAEDSQFDIAIDVDLKTIRYAQLGALVRAADWLRLGASFRDEFQLEVAQAVIIQGQIGSPEMPIVEDAFLHVESLSQDLFQPAELTVGAAVDIGARWMVSGDLSFHRWSRFQNPAAKIDLELDAGMFNDMIDLPDEPPTFPAPNFHDIYVPRLGVEYLAEETSARKVHLRGGYAYEPSPAPEQTGENNFVDNDKHTVSFGVGYTMFDVGSILLQPLSIDAFAAITFLPERTHRKESPVDPVGDYRADGAIAQVGLQTRWRF